MKRRLALVIAPVVASLAVASPVLADHSIGPVTPNTGCYLALADGPGRTVIVTGHVHDPPDSILLLRFDSKMEPLSLRSRYRGTRSHLQLDFSTPPEVGETVFPVMEMFRNGDAFRYVFRTAGVRRLTVTGEMVGRKCGASIVLAGVPDTSMETPLRPSESPAPVLLVVFGAAAGVLYRRSFRPSAATPNPSRAQ